MTVHENQLGFKLLSRNIYFYNIKVPKRAVNATCVKDIQCQNYYNLTCQGGFCL